ncbi:hypothetical protein GCM10010400_06550 [Streptomyces aculeolatus]
MINAIGGEKAPRRVRGDGAGDGTRRAGPSTKLSAVEQMCAAQGGSFSRRVLDTAEWAAKLILRAGPSPIRMSGG